MVSTNTQSAQSQSEPKLSSVDGEDYVDDISSSSKKKSKTSSHDRKRARRTPQCSDETVSIDDFTLLQSSHPYGVLPNGNRFFSVDSSTRNTNHTIDPETSLCTTDARLVERSPTDLLHSEECWNTILSYCDGTTVSKIGQTCRFLYVASHQPEIWRDLVLVLLLSSSSSSPSPNLPNKNTITRVGSSWKQTYILLYNHMSSTHLKRTTTAATTANHQPPPHVPISVHGSVYSDYYYRLHTCRSFSIPTAWFSLTSTSTNSQKSTNRNQVRTIPVEQMTTERFLQEFEIPNIPVNIQGGCQSWAAYHKWSDPSYLQKQTQTQTFRTTSGVAPYPAQFTFSAYRDYCMGITVDDKTVTNKNDEHLLEEGPLYLFDRTALQPNSILWKDYMHDLQRTCPYWDPDPIHCKTETDHGGHDLFGLFGEGRRPDHTWLICGPKRSGSVFHIDPNGTHAWNATIVGHKRWIFYPPGVTPPGVYPSEDGDEVALPLTIGEWIYQYWEEHCARKRHARTDDTRPLECTTQPGDVVFVPHGWWHLVINLDEWNIAITHNYVSRSNLSNVLRFLREKRDQVSGCRDRNESIKPERLYEEFVQTLQERYPQWLQEALDVPDWTCRAWKKCISTMNEHPPTVNGTSVVSSNAIATTTTSIIEKAKSGGSSTSFSFAFNT